MKKALLSVFFVGSLLAQDPTNVDNTRMAEASRHLMHTLELHTYWGRPLNLDSDREVIVLINHGYVLGFSPDRKQPVWAAYRVAEITEGLNYERPHLFYDDIRLPKAFRIGSETFGGGYDRGHMVPNSAINTQYGRLSQMETFLMSNICPQRGQMNQGVWRALEQKIANDYAASREHVWVLIGPIFGNNPQTLTRDNGIEVPIADSFYCILVDPQNYPWGPGNSDFLALEIPQQPSSPTLSNSYITTIDAIEAKTDLNFLPRLTTSQQSSVEATPASTIW